MKVTLNIEKRYAYTIIGILIILVGVVAVNATYPVNVFDAPSHSLQRVAKCVNEPDKIPPVVCSLGQDHSSVDYNTNGKIDFADRAEYAGTADYALLAGDTGDFTFTTYRVNYLGEDGLPSSLDLGSHKFCFLSGIGFSLTGDWGNPWCTLFLNGNSWNLALGTDRSEKMIRNCWATCAD